MRPGVNQPKLKCGANSGDFILSLIGKGSQLKKRPPLKYLCKTGDRCGEKKRASDRTNILAPTNVKCFFIV